MTIKYFENKKTGSPTERLTFKSEEEFNTFCNRIEGTAEFNRECLAEEPDENYNKSLLEMLNRLKKKKRMTQTEEGVVPVTFINAEDFHLLTLAFIDAIGW
jgi:hypothetical protein